MPSLRRFLIGTGLATLVLTSLCSISRGDDAAAPSGAWIGVAVERLAAGAAADANCVLVAEVTSGGPAARAGVKPGDVLLVVGSTTLHGPRDLASAERRLTPDEPVSVVLSRDGGRMMRVVNVTPELSPAVKRAMLERGNPDAPVPGGSVAAPATPAAPGDDGPPAEPEALAPPKSAPPEAAAPAPAAEATKPAPAADAARPTAPAARDAGALGFDGHDLDPDLAAALGMSDVHGVMVLKVESGGAADRAGLRTGDVITQVGDADVGSIDELGKALASAAGDLTFHVHHHGVQRDIDIAAAPKRNDAAVAPKAAAEAPEARVEPPAEAVAPEARTQELPAPDASAPDHAAPSADLDAPGSAHDPAVEQSIQELRDEVRVLRAELTRLRAQVQELRGN
jgi:PDZ domain